MTRLRAGGVILLALVLVASACGDDDASATTTEATVSTVADDDAVTSATTTTTTAADEGDDDDAGSAATTEAGDDGGGAGDLLAVLSSSDCLAAASALASAFSGGFSPTGVFNAGDVAAAFDRMSDVAPSEIKDDLATMADALSEFFTILESENVDLSNPATFADPAVQDALQRAAEKMEATEFEEAAENVGTWFEDECAGLGG